MRTLLTASVLGLACLLLATGGQAAASMAGLQQQIDRAQPGDTLVIAGGEYHENIVIDKPLILEGRDSPVIDGEGEGDVVTIAADDVTLSRFVIRNSGRAVSQEPAAIKVIDAHAPVIKGNRIESSHFGIHVTGSHHPEISLNTVDLGKETPIERRGHGIYLWEVSEAAIHANTIANAGDGIHLEFSDDNGIGQNVVTGSRYALHFMSSNNNRVLENKFEGNLSGAVLMFSHELLVKDNELSNNRAGASGAGMLIKDVDNIFVQGNVIQRNKYGITVEGTPNTQGASATFLENTLALNDTGIGLFSNAPITFVENAMIENIVQVEAVSGAVLSAGLSEGHASSVPSTPVQAGHEGHEGAAAAVEPPASNGVQPEAAVWSIAGRGNYWSDYRGYDADGDGVGDEPYRPEPPFAGALADDPTLRLFQFTLAQHAIDMASDMFPVYQYDPVIEDSAPLTSAPGPALSDEGGMNGGVLLVSILLLAFAAALMVAVMDVDPVTAAARHVRPISGRFEGGSS